LTHEADAATIDFMDRRRSSVWFGLLFFAIMLAVEAHAAEMAIIPGGPFLMGSMNGDPDERPVHTVYLDAFYMDRYPVTNADYARSPSRNPKGPESGSLKVLRGGSWFHKESWPVATRSKDEPLSHVFCFVTGFRCVKDAN